MEEVLEAGADCVLGKPYRIEELLVSLAGDAGR
jgi:DNA-binding response OmpR family regulator